MKKSMKKICVFLAVLLTVVALPVSAQADGRKKTDHSGIRYDCKSRPEE